MRKSGEESWNRAADWLRPALSACVHSFHHAMLCYAERGRVKMRGGAGLQVITDYIIGQSRHGQWVQRRLYAMRACPVFLLNVCLIFTRPI